MPDRRASATHDGQTAADQQRVFDPPYGANRAYWKGHLVRELPDELIDELIGQVASFGRPSVGILLESLHGAPKDADPASAAALSHDDMATIISEPTAMMPTSARRDPPSRISGRKRIRYVQKPYMATETDTE